MIIVMGHVNYNINIKYILCFVNKGRSGNVKASTCRRSRKKDSDTSRKNKVFRLS